MTAAMTEPRRLVFVTGPSGAGRSSAIRVLEDLGYEAIDNMPVPIDPCLAERSNARQAGCAWH